jgi:hypothetical protein
MKILKASYGDQDVTTVVKSLRHQKCHMMLINKEQMRVDKGTMATLKITLKHRELVCSQGSIVLLKPLIVIHQIVVIYNKYVITLANDFKNSLEQVGCRVVLKHDFDQSSQDLHIILGPRRFVQMPNLYIIYQLEQYDRSGWITPKVVSFIRHSLITLEYNRVNLSKFDSEMRKHVTYQPVPITPQMIQINGYDNQYDLLFYGGLSERRQKILNALKHRGFKIMICDNKFGQDLLQVLTKTKIVLNLHICDQCLFEVVRIHEVLRYLNLIISEKPSNPEDQSYITYHDVVNFVDPITSDLKNLEQLVIQIGYCLSHFDLMIKEQTLKRPHVIKTLYESAKEIIIHNLFT